MEKSNYCENCKETRCAKDGGVADMDEMKPDCYVNEPHKPTTINYTSDNLFDIQCLRVRLHDHVKALELKKRESIFAINELNDVIAALDWHIDCIDKQNLKEEPKND